MFFLNFNYSLLSSSLSPESSGGASSAWAGASGAGCSNHSLTMGDVLPGCPTLMETIEFLISAVSLVSKILVVCQG